MKHLGDITKIDGSAAPVVEVVIGGSPCQDLSVAGKRAGLSGERSGLFMEQIRIIKEMREHDRQSGSAYIRPRYMVWENVPGAFSSNKGEDLRVVLEETARVSEPTAVIPRPEGGNKWSNSGAVLGDGWSIAWRVFDAQFWGVPQRRRRIALVADFGGESAPEILFERESVSGNIEESCEQGKGAPQSVESCFGTSSAYGIPLGFRPENTRAYKDKATTVVSGSRPGFCNGVIVYNGENITSPINKANPQDGDRPAVVMGGKGLLIQEDRSGTLAANNDQFAVIALDRAAFNQGEHAQYGFKIDDNGVNSTVVSKGPSAVCTNLVRRLTPLECERLQGFPDDYTDIGDYTDTNGKKRKTSDSARYKALGNSIALPSWAWLLERLNGYCRYHTMASLFDGIGGFPLIWETLNGKGSCVWASEIEEFPIAVTKYHFGEE